MMNGIDVSSYQGLINWDEVKKSGPQFAILRAGYGNTAKQKDKWFDRNVQGMTAAGIPAGAYWFSYAATPEEARQEARACQEVLRPYWGKLEFPIYYDFEYSSDQYVKAQTGKELSKQERTQIIAAFLEEMERAGYCGGLYTNRDYIQNKILLDSLAQYELWVADYSRQPDPRAGLWQTGDAGVVAGISVRVDTDKSLKDYPEIPRAEGKNGLQPKADWTSDTTTTVSLRKCGMYTAKITGRDIGLVAGTPGVVCLERCRREGDATFWHVIGIGEPGAETGIYPSEGGDRIFVARIIR